MSTRKQNQTLVRWIIVLVSVLTGVGIWAAVNKPVQTSAASANTATPTSITTTDPNFNYTDTFLTQPAQPSQQYVQPRTTPRLRTRAS